MKENFKYRKDIDGLRAIAVLAVIIFHLGYLPNGYLGVDIFFGISGYLITSLVYNEAVENRFSILAFYLRRIRRIIPLILFTSLVALVIGLMVMLPEDLKNLTESLVATNVFSNNILSKIASADYWDIANDYKPMMHTWSLGVEEQFYILFPIIFLVCNGKRSKFALPILFTLSIISLLLFFGSHNEISKFFLIQYRFFELSIGGIAAILFKNKNIKAKYSIILLVALIILLYFNIPLNADIKLLLTVFITVWLLVVGSNDNNKFSKLLLQNNVLLFLGKISFSLYMWHQIVLAYTRYFIVETISFPVALLVFAIAFFLSILSYYLIEQPFRDKKRIKTSTLLVTQFVFFALIVSSSVYIYERGGVIRNVPEMGLYKSDKPFNIMSPQKNINVEYNNRISNFNRMFSNEKTLKVLIVGNSRARDFANLLLESNIQDLELSYVLDVNS